MKIGVLGGCGIQGRATVFDLTRCEDVDEVICADACLDDLDLIKPFTDMSKVKAIKVDAAVPEDLIELFHAADVIIDLLPRQFFQAVFEIAIKTGVSLVNTNYIPRGSELDKRAKKAGIIVLPESGLDPGIDLVIYGHALSFFDEIHVINSYCGGFPEKSACDNPLNYKVSWTWEGVLSSCIRDARMIKNGKLLEIPGFSQHDPEFIQPIDFPGLGPLEAIPNRDAVYYTDLLGVTSTIRESGRYSLRWPGWSAFWRPLKQLGFLSDQPIPGLASQVSPFEFLNKIIGPQIQYKEGEKDLVAMWNLFEGLSNGNRIRRTYRLFIARDLSTGLMAMSQGVGYSASIAAQMIAKGAIRSNGVLSPAVHLPFQLFFDQLAKRELVVEIKDEVIG